MRLPIAVVLACTMSLSCAERSTSDSVPAADVLRPEIPKTWDDELMKDLEVPLAKAEYSPRQVSSDYYYKIPVRPMYKTYPVYHPDREPPDYIESLRKKEPESVWNPANLKTEEDWIRAGELVFEDVLPGFIGMSPIYDDLYIRTPEWLERVKPPVAKDGTIPGYRYIVREKGKVEVGSLSCSMCHTRVMPDGAVLKGAQGNFPFDRAFAADLRRETDLPMNRVLLSLVFTQPWSRSAFMTRLERANAAELAESFQSTPPGALTRHRSTLGLPIQVPDLIGVEHRKYLDRTGLQRHHGIGDLMRYAALNQGGDGLATFGDFVPGSVFSGGKFPEAKDQLRYSDEQLYALALYIYSLRPPPNPNKFDAAAAEGEKIFRREGCTGCHTPPLYTNNKLTPAIGFKIPPGHKEKYDVLDVVVGTDPRLTLDTLRGTGYYKVPSLLGVWYRGPLEHNGSVATLEDWFDPNRLRGDYVPTGFKGTSKTRAVKGHEFGLKLSPEEKRLLIAFLRTL